MNKLDKYIDIIAEKVDPYRHSFYEVFLGILVFFAVLDVFNLIWIAFFDPTKYPSIFLFLIPLVVVVLLVQDQSEFKAKYANNRILLVGAVAYFSYVLSMIAYGKRVFIVEIILFTAIYGLWAISLNMSTGVVGLLNFGVIAQVAVGAVAMGIASVNGWPIFLAVVLGMVVSGVFSALLAFTTVRLRDDYFAIISITVGEIFRQFLITEPTLRASPSLSPGQKYPATPGILSIPQPFSEWYTNLIQGTFLEVYGYRLFLAIFGLFLLVVTYFVAERIFNSPYGRVLRSIREDDQVVESYGKDVLKIKIVIMFISGAIAGLGGALYGWTIVSLFPNNFLPLFTFYVWIAFIIGGRGNNKGMIFGGIIFVILERTSRFLDNRHNPFIVATSNIVHFLNPQAPDITLAYIQLIVVGLFLIIFLRFLPRGIVPEEPFEPDIAGYRLPERGSQSQDQKSHIGGNEDE